MIRGMTVSDIPAVFSIEQSVQRSSWSQSQFLNSLVAKDDAWVFEEADIILGYLIIKPVLEEGEVLTIGVSKAAQRKGIARQLLEGAVISFASLYLEVRVSNNAAIALYEALGFQQISRRKNYYKTEDALIMKKCRQASSAP